MPFDLEHATAGTDNTFSHIRELTTPSITPFIPCKNTTAGTTHKVVSFGSIFHLDKLLWSLWPLGSQP